MPKSFQNWIRLISSATTIELL